MNEEKLIIADELTPSIECEGNRDFVFISKAIPTFIQEANYE